MGGKKIGEKMTVVGALWHDPVKIKRIRRSSAGRLDCDRAM
jgi:hypothetical protein